MTMSTNAVLTNVLDNIVEIFWPGLTHACRRVNLLATLVNTINVQSWITVGIFCFEKF